MCIQIFQSDQTNYNIHLFPQPGAFGLRNPQGKVMTLDWGAIYTAAHGTPATVPGGTHVSPSIEYVAFATDPDHWVEPVVSGYRVTVTFHLFHESLEHSSPERRDQQQVTGTQMIQEIQALHELKTIVESHALHDVPIVFPVIHEYSERHASSILLKGSDSILFQLLHVLGGKPRIMYYNDISRYEDDFHDGIERGLIQRGTLMKDDIEIEDQRKSMKVDKNNLQAKAWKRETVALKRLFLLTDYAHHELVNDQFDEHGHEYNLGELGNAYEAIFVYHSNAHARFSSAAGHYGNQSTICSYNGNACCIVVEW